MSAGNKWKDEHNGKIFFEKGFSQRTHSGILKDEQYIQDILGYLQ